MPLEKVISSVPQALTTLINKVLPAVKIESVAAPIINDKDTKALTKTLNAFANSSKAVLLAQDKAQSSSYVLCDEALNVIYGAQSPKKNLANASRLFYHQG